MLTAAVRLAFFVVDVAIAIGNAVRNIDEWRRYISDERDAP